jgi:type II secretory pathway pseudopilin PulG
MRLAMALVGVVALLVVSGCYGSTEPATNVSFDGAQLNARGTANNGAAYSYFEYWPTGNAQAKRTTVTRHWPSGASAPFSERTDTLDSPLYASTPYSFRLCGNDEGKSAVCAQTLTFTTKAPTKDAVEGRWSATGDPIGNFGSVQASSGPSGQSPTGTLKYTQRIPEIRYAGRVTCLSVSGNRAVVGTVGEVTDGGGTPNPNVNPPTARAVATIVDGGPGVVDRVAVVGATGSTPPACTAATTLEGQATEGVVVYDAP